MELTEAQNHLITKIAKENDFHIFKFDGELGSQKGDNFLGKIARIMVKDESKKLAIIMKSSPTNENQRKIQPIRLFYLREFYLYETIFKEYSDFEDEYNITNRFKAHAKFFGKLEEELNETLVLEDMKEKGYQMCNKRITMNSHHIEKVLKEYANFHAISFAMKAKNPDRFKKLTENLTVHFSSQNDGNKEFQITYLEILFFNLYKSVEDDPKATEELKKFEDVLRKNGMPQEDDPNHRLVVTHGDCWCNNFLFNYEDENKDKPSEICILDWQMSKLGSPADDLCYFLFVNASNEILDNYKKYLILYYSVLSQKLKEFSCDVEDLFPFETLEAQFNKYSKQTLFTCVLIMKILLCEPDEAPNFDIEIKEISEVKNIIDFSLTNTDEYHRRLSCIVKFLVKNNLLLPENC